MRFSTMCLISTLICVGHLGAQTPTLPPVRFRLLSYNIHHAEGVDGKLNLERIAQVIKESEADVIALQEVDRNVPRSDNVDQPQRLAELLRMHVAFGDNIELEGGQYGNAVLSRFPLQEVKNHPLPPVNGGEQRGVLQVEFELPSKVRATLFATHFDHRPNDEQRIASAKLINELRASVATPLVLLAGDLNATMASSAMNELDAVWRTSSLMEQPTIPVNKPERQIDFIMHARPFMDSTFVLHALSTTVLAEATASDHRAILTSYELSRLPSSETVVSRIAFGSCINQELDLPIFTTILADHPDLMLFLGDNIYADTDDLQVLRAKYAKLGSKREFQQLMRSTRVMATWDDHDYGRNDGGADFGFRTVSQAEFMKFWNEPVDSPRRFSPGVYEAKTFGPSGQRLQVIMLDTRYFRSPLKVGGKRVGGAYIPDDDPTKTLLGETQWTWLEQQLDEPAEVRLLVSSIQCIPSDAGQETWANLPHERERLLKLIESTRANSIVLLSGDRHWSEISKLERTGQMPLLEMTSSSFNQIHERGTPTENRFRDVPTTYHLPNYGWIDVDWSGGAPRIKLQIRDLAGKPQLEKQL
ncbi:MAG: alkaline phosphatase D family protein [Pirellulaceae bacterium]